MIAFNHLLTMNQATNQNQEITKLSSLQRLTQVYNVQTLLIWRRLKRPLKCITDTNCHKFSLPLSLFDLRNGWAPPLAHLLLSALSDS